MTGKNHLGMTLVEVVVSMSILALAVAVTFAAISMSMRTINRATDVKNEYEQVAGKMQDAINSEKGDPTYVSVSEIEGDTKTALAEVSMKRIEVSPNSENDSVIGSFYYYTIQ